MADITVKYLVVKRKKGRTFYYWQPKKQYLIAGVWEKCPLNPVRLARESGNILDAAKEAQLLNSELKKWREGKSDGRIRQPGTTAWLISKYKEDSRFTNLALSTKKLYEHYFPMIEDELGDVPLGAITRRAARAFCTSFPGTSRKPSMIAGICRLLFNFARDLGELQINPFDELRISKPQARTAVWTSDKIEELQKIAIDNNAASIALMVQLGLDTGQRPSDLRKLTWNNYTGTSIRVRQSKTKVWVEIPVMPKLKKMLDAADRKSPVILINEDTGKPYSRERYSEKFRELCTKIGVGMELQFRDLRRTAVVRLGEHGCTNAEIAAITGHTIADTEKILEVYLPRNSEMAKNAIAKLQKLEPPQSNSQ